MRLQVGWSARHRGWTFPMCNGDGEVVGIRLRLLSGKKLSVKGGREGLFLPSGLQRGQSLLIAEGPTDAAALLDFGFPAVGRPSCTGGTKHICELVRRLQPSELVLLADNDEPGQRGAGNLLSVVVAYVPAVRIITPPAGIKDARAWKAAGATVADISAAIEAAPVRRLAVSVRRKAGKHHGGR